MTIQKTNNSQPVNQPPELFCSVVIPALERLAPEPARKLHELIGTTVPIRAARYLNAAGFKKYAEEIIKDHLPKKTDSMFDQAYALSELAFYQAKVQPKKAEKTFNEALKTADKIEDHFDRSLSYQHAASKMADAGWTDMAIAVFEGSLTASQKIDDLSKRLDRQLDLANATAESAFFEAAIITAEALDRTYVFSKVARSIAGSDVKDKLPLFEKLAAAVSKIEDESGHRYVCGFEEDEGRRTGTAGNVASFIYSSGLEEAKTCALLEKMMAGADAPPAIRSETFLKILRIALIIGLKESIEPIMGKILAASEDEIRKQRCNPSFLSKRLEHIAETLAHFGRQRDHEVAAFKRLVGLFYTYQGKGKYMEIETLSSIIYWAVQANLKTEELSSILKEALDQAPPESIFAARLLADQVDSFVEKDVNAFFNAFITYIEALNDHYRKAEVSSKLGAALLKYGKINKAGRAFSLAIAAAEKYFENFEEGEDVYNPVFLRDVLEGKGNEGRVFLPNLLRNLRGIEPQDELLQEFADGIVAVSDRFKRIGNVVIAKAELAQALGEVGLKKRARELFSGVIPLMDEIKYGGIKDFEHSTVFAFLLEHIDKADLGLELLPLLELADGSIDILAMEDEAKARGWLAGIAGRAGLAERAEGLFLSAISSAEWLDYTQFGKGDDENFCSALNNIIGRIERSGLKGRSAGRVFNELTGVAEDIDDEEKRSGVLDKIADAKERVPSQK